MLGFGGPEQIGRTQNLLKGHLKYSGSGGEGEKQK